MSSEPRRIRELTSASPPGVYLVGTASGSTDRIRIERDGSATTGQRLPGVGAAAIQRDGQQRPISEFALAEGMQGSAFWWKEPEERRCPLDPYYIGSHRSTTTVLWIEQEGS